MTAARARVVASSLLAAALAGGCMYVRPALQPGPWDLYGNSGPLKVRGAPPSAPGPRIVRSLRRQPDLAELLERQGEPDTVEVVGDRLDPKRLILTYRRADAGPPRRIVLDPTNAGYAARAPQFRRPTRTVARREESREATLPAAPGRRATRARPPRAAAATTASAAGPTSVQRLECPIDRERADCRAYCVAGASWDWCP